MEINANYFSFPPHLSTSWNQVTALSVNVEGRIVFHLSNSESVTLPLLTKEETNQVFKAHAEFLEKEILVDKPTKNLNPNTLVKFALGSPDNPINEILHNPAQQDAPDLPNDILDKLAQVTRLLLGGDVENFPMPEDNCNCFHCQVARSVHGATFQRSIKNEFNQEADDSISDKELEFQQWHIQQTGDKLYSVTNKLDSEEKYSVYLGHPIGCTCGKTGCEHILVVLKS